MKTVRVRIAVCVAPDGSYYSCGYGTPSKPNDTEDEANIMAVAGDVYGDRDEPWPTVAEYWIEADVPIPEATTIEGEVKS